LRHLGMDDAGYMPDEAGYTLPAKVAVGPGTATRPTMGQSLDTEYERGVEEELELAMEKREHPEWEDESPAGGKPKKMPIFTRELFQEVFLNPGLVLLIGGIVIGLISGLQGQKVVADDDRFFVLAFQGVLCLFLLEMGMTASRKLRTCDRRASVSSSSVCWPPTSSRRWGSLSLARMPTSPTPTSSREPTFCSRCC